jgi:hypothetical protein
MAARATLEQRLRNLLATVENGAGTMTIFQAIKDREAEMRGLDAQLAALDEPLDQRLAVIPSWVKAQLADLAGLLREGPEHAKAEFQKLGLRYAITPIHDGPHRIYLRAEGSGDFEHVAFARYAELSTVDASPVAATRRSPRRRGKSRASRGPA